MAKAGQSTYRKLLGNFLGLGQPGEKGNKEQQEVSQQGQNEQQVLHGEKASVPAAVHLTLSAENIDRFREKFKSGIQEPYQRWDEAYGERPAPQAERPKFR